MTKKIASAAVKMEPPANWRLVMENIRRLRQRFPAPVDTMGCSQASTSEEARAPHQEPEQSAERRFQVLVSLMLSSQTKDQITWAAVQRLRKAQICTPQAMREAPEKDIEDLIYPVGFYRRKAVHLRKVAALLSEQYAGDIPRSVEELCLLPGVGPKMAHLCMNEAWQVVTGIGVDTHVHRISGRLGWVPAAGIKTPEDTRKALESWLPREHWREINLLLVGFGQTVCSPVRPKCHDCYNQLICPSSSTRAQPAGKVTAGAATKSALKGAGEAPKKRPAALPTRASERTKSRKRATLKEEAEEAKTEPLEEPRPVVVRVKVEVERV